MGRWETTFGAAAGAETEQEARDRAREAGIAVDDQDEDEAASDAAPEQRSAETEAAIERLHDPAEQFRILHPEVFEVTLTLEGERDEEREEDDGAGSTRTIKVRVPTVVTRNVGVRYDLKPKDIAERRIWDHFGHLIALARAELRRYTADVPQDLSTAWLEARPGFTEAVMHEPNIRAKGREIVALLAEAYVVVDGKETVQRVSEDEISSGMDDTTFDVVLMALVRRYMNEVERRKNRLAGAAIAKNLAAAAPATSTAPSSPPGSPMRTVPTG